MVGPSTVRTILAKAGTKGSQQDPCLSVLAVRRGVPLRGQRNSHPLPAPPQTCGNSRKCPEDNWRSYIRQHFARSNPNIELIAGLGPNPKPRGMHSPRVVPGRLIVVKRD